jgi:hypothetical protein
MAVVRLLRVALLLPLLLGPLCLACGGDGDDEEQEPVSSERRGPAGCYIEDERRCDCELEQAACTDDVGIWVDTGCATCAM